MKKGLIILCIMLGLSSLMSAREIKTTDGKVYKNVSISSVTPVGIDIFYVKDGGYFIKLLPFTLLSKEIQKEFGYDPQKAKTYLANLKNHSEMIRKKHEEQVKQDKTKNAKHYEMISRIEAGKVNAILKITAVKPDGIIAYADNQGNTSTYVSGRMGKVFVYGLIGMSGAVEARWIYPTGQTKYGFPCYAVTLDQAVILKNDANK